ncbi:hypothetical protein Tco_0431929 [Tanacetum coccineum]
MNGSVSLFVSDYDTKGLTRLSEERVREVEGRKEKIIEESGSYTFPTPIRSLGYYYDIVSSGYLRRNPKILTVNENEQGPSTLGNQEQEDDYDFWTESYASDDDEIPTKQMSQGDEHQYHIDQMKNFLKSDIVWESRKEILVSSHPQKTTPIVQSCQRDPEALALSLINQDLLYLKKGSFIKTYWELGHEHKFITEIVARRGLSMQKTVVSLICISNSSEVCDMGKSLKNTKMFSSSRRPYMEINIQE